MMRATLFIIALALPLAACGKNETTQQNGSGPAMTAEAIDSNDVTAIDAVTGEAANMAADVEFDANEMNALDNAASSEAGASTRPARKAATSTPAPKAEPAASPTESNAD